MVKAVRKRTAAPRRRSAAPTPASTNPIDIAMEAEQDNRRPDSPARRLLENQNTLVKLQVALAGLTIVAGLAAALALGLMAWGAGRADGMVIHAFSVPPDLAAKGLTGEVVAVRVLDRLARMSREANVAEPPGRFDSDWANQISVEIPQTGVSVTELQRLLRSWLGKEIHLRGEVVRTPQGVSVMARAGTDATPARAGAEADLDLLLDGLAEDVLGRTQAKRYGQWLVGRGRNREALAVFDQLIASGGGDGQAWAYAGRGNALMPLDVAAARQALRQAIPLDPKGRTQARSLLPIVENWMGHPEAALAAMHDAAKLNQKDPSRLPEFRRQRTILDPANLAAAIGDFAGAQKGYAALMDRDLLGSPFTHRPTRVQYINSLARLHEPTAAMAAVEAYQAGRPALNMREIASLSEARTLAAMALEDWPNTVQPPPGVGDSAGRPAVAVRSVPGLLALGRIDEARALVDATPLDCQPCIIARGQVAAAQGQKVVADHWFGEAVRLAPSLPFAEHAWAQALLDRGDIAGALAKTAAAYAKSPRYPDNIELWGEALLKKGDAEGAAAKFAETATLAPRWGRNQILWGEALHALGSKAEAIEHWRAALTMDLSPLDEERAQANLLAS